MHDFAPFGYFLVFWRAASIRQASKTNLRSVREAFIWDRASIEQVRSVRARYVKREAREGDDGMGLKYPQKEIACDWGRGRCGLAFRSHVFWWNVTEKATFQIRFPEWKCVKTPFFFYFRALVTGRKRLRFPSLAFLKWWMTLRWKVKLPRYMEYHGKANTRTELTFKQFVSPVAVFVL